MNKAGRKENTIFLHAFWLSLHFRVRVLLFVSLSICVPLSLSRSLVAHSFSLNSFLPRCSLLSLLCLPASLDRWSLARSLTHSACLSLYSLYSALSAVSHFCLLSLACSDFCLCRCCCAAWTSFAVGSIAFRFVSYHFVPPSETNELTHTQACMHACTCACLYDSWHCYTCSHIILLSTSCGFAVVFCGPPIIISPTCQSFLPR